MCSSPATWLAASASGSSSSESRSRPLSRRSAGGAPETRSLRRGSRSSAALRVRHHGRARGGTRAAECRRLDLPRDPARRRRRAGSRISIAFHGLVHRPGSVPGAPLAVEVATQVAYGTRGRPARLRSDLFPTDGCCSPRWRIVPCVDVAGLSRRVDYVRLTAAPTRPRSNGCPTTRSGSRALPLVLRRDPPRRRVVDRPPARGRCRLASSSAFGARAGDQRQQTKWLAFAAALLPIGIIATGRPAPAVHGVIATIELLCGLRLALPVAIGIARAQVPALRHRPADQPHDLLPAGHGRAGRSFCRDRAARDPGAAVLVAGRCRRLDACRGGAVQSSASSRPGPGRSPLQPHPLRRRGSARRVRRPAPWRGRSGVRPGRAARRRRQATSPAHASIWLRNDPETATR